MKTGIWGAGNIAHTHAEALKASGVEIAAIVDINEAKAKEFADTFGIEKYGTDESILLTEDITTVHVCTPPNLHFEMVMKLLEHGKNVLCEKPLCFDNHQAEILAAKAKEAGVVCAINFNVRFHMACQKARQVVASENFGNVNLIHGNYLQQFACFPAPIDWRYNEVLAGRMYAVTEIGTHWMDIAQYISGRKVTAVSANFGRFYPERYVENNLMYPDSDNGRRTETRKVNSEMAAAINLKFDNGAIGTVLLSEISQGRVNRINLEVTGDYENVWWNSEDNNLLHTARRDQGVNTEIFAFGNGFMDTFRSLVNEFYKDVRAGRQSENPVYPTFTEGMEIVKICNALLESADNDEKWVSLA